MDFLRLETTILPIKAETVFTVAGFEISNAMMSGLLVTLIIATILIIFNLKFKAKGTPGTFQLVLEMLVEAILGFITQITGDEKVARKILPLVGGLMIYLLLANTILTIPGIGSLLYDGVTVFRAHTTDFNATFGIAVSMVIFTHLASISKVNIFNHLNKYLRIGTVISSFRKGIGPGMLSLIDLFIGFLDIVSEFAKSLSISLRLFGNMFAGEVLGSVIAGLIALFAPIPLLILSLFSGAIQAVVFTALTASFFGGQLSEE